MPAEVVRGRGGLPPSGGSVEIAGTSLAFAEADIFLGGDPDEGTGRVHWGIFTEDRTSGIGLEYDPEADRFFMGWIIRNEESADLSEPCPIAHEELGRINEMTKVVRLSIDCTDIAAPGGGTGSVTGTIVADVIEDFMGPEQ